MGREHVAKQVAESSVINIYDNLRSIIIIFFLIYFVLSILKDMVAVDILTCLKEVKQS